MFNDVNDIAEFYNNNTDNEHDRLVRHQLEHDLHLALPGPIPAAIGAHPGDRRGNREIYSRTGETRLETDLRRSICGDGRAVQAKSSRQGSR